jgi:hypothetical protein
MNPSEFESKRFILNLGIWRSNGAQQIANKEYFRNGSIVKHLCSSIPSFNSCFATYNPGDNETAAYIPSSEDLASEILKILDRKSCPQRNSILKLAMAFLTNDSRKDSYTMVSDIWDVEDLGSKRAACEKAVDDLFKKYCQVYETAIDLHSGRKYSQRK